MASVRRCRVRTWPLSTLTIHSPLFLGKSRLSRTGVPKGLPRHDAFRPPRVYRSWFLSQSKPPGFGKVSRTFLQLASDSPAVYGKENNNTLNEWCESSNASPPATAARNAARNCKSQSEQQTSTSGASSDAQFSRTPAWRASGALCGLDPVRWTLRGHAPHVP